MDTTQGSMRLDEADELSDLRRRAYGPRADIASDPVALARLGVLEDAARSIDPIDAADGASPEGLLPRDEPEPGAVPPPVDSQAVPSHTESDGERVPGPEHAARTARSASPWWHRRRLWVLSGAALVLVLLVFVIIAWLSPRPPDAVLNPVAGSTEEAEDVFGSLDYLGLDAADLTTYEYFRGVTVSSGDTEHGTRCLVVAGDRSGLWGAGCAPPGLDPVVDVLRYTGFDDSFYGDLPVGSLVRFVLTDGRVEVFMARAEAPETE